MRVLQQMIDRRLLADQAKKEGVDTTPEYISRKRRSEDDLLISMLSAQRFKSVALPSARDTDAYIASHPAMFANRQLWELDQIQYQPPSDPAQRVDRLLHDVGAEIVDQLGDREVVPIHLLPAVTAAVGHGHRFYHKWSISPGGLLHPT